MRQSDDPDTEALVEHLDAALDHLLAARVSLGGLDEVDLPDEALDVAMAADEGFQEARRHFREAWQEVREAAGSECPQELLRLEAAANALVVQGTKVGWRLGLQVQNRP